MPNPARAELHLLHPERHDKAEEAEQVLRAMLPDLEQAAGGRVIGSVSVRHDPMDAIEETLFTEPIDEIILDVHDRAPGRPAAPGPAAPAGASRHPGEPRQRLGSPPGLTAR